MDPTDEEFPEFSATNSDDHAILMHRDAHFSGNFAMMVDYYNQEGKGVKKEFELQRIKELAAYEAATQQNLAAKLLSGAEMEKVSRAKKSYKALRDLCEMAQPKDIRPRLIAELVLSEEEEPQAEIAAIAAEQGAIVPLLIELLTSEDFADSLFPGYGLAPQLAARCLGKIGDKRAIISLFESIGQADFFNEDCVLEALKEIGLPAKEFLLKVVHGRPLNFDNERAAIALVHFRNDPIVAETCLQMLLSKDTWNDPALATHLILACEGLDKIEDRQKLLALAEDPKFPKILIQDLKLIKSYWPERS